MSALYVLLGGIGTGLLVALGGLLRKFSPFLYGLALGTVLGAAGALSLTDTDLMTVWVLAALAGTALIAGGIRATRTRITQTDTD